MTNAPDALARAAIEPIHGDMLVGLGTGRAATRAIHALAEKAKRGEFAGPCVATSVASAKLGAELGLRILDMGGTAKVDYLFDGADEVDPELRMIKGGGGAMTREKIVAHASSTCVYMIQQSKLAGRLGESFRLPIEVLEFARAMVESELRSAGLEPELRKRDGAVVMTDQENVILDVSLDGKLSPEEVNAMLNALPGVVDHGLFLTQADTVFVESEETALKRLTR
ncbi:MAG: ribose-5-phosphate isomerase RpiA [Planctomycetota bacterium]